MGKEINMGHYDKVFSDVISGRKDTNIRFNDLCGLLDNMEFRCSIRGDHYIYRRDDTPIINIQPDGNKAKAYQVKQVRDIIVSRGLGVK